MKMTCTVTVSDEARPYIDVDTQGRIRWTTSGNAVSTSIGPPISYAHSLQYKSAYNLWDIRLSDAGTYTCAGMVQARQRSYIVDSHTMSRSIQLSVIGKNINTALEVVQYITHIMIFNFIFIDVDVYAVAVSETVLMHRDYNRVVIHCTIHYQPLSVLTPRETRWTMRSTGTDLTQYSRLDGDVSILTTTVRKPGVETFTCARNLHFNDGSITENYSANVAVTVKGLKNI